jgi:predicted unusual protein kinase regulating ubiquinone biosynthesis (AarF/ABC1/UbiB family)
MRGSLSQVHLATLKHAHGRFERGRKVAVKVQHPNLAERLTLDMAILMSAADLVGSVAGVRIHDFHGWIASITYVSK